MIPFRRLALLIAAVPAMSLAQPAEPLRPPSPPLETPPLVDADVTAAPVITLDQLVRADDQRMTCDQLRGEVRSLAKRVRLMEIEAEKLQTASSDKATAERLASASKARSDAQDQRDKQRLASNPVIAPSKLTFDPNHPSNPPAPDMTGIASLDAPFKGSASTVTPTQMRQYRLIYMAAEKGC